MNTSSLRTTVFIFGVWTLLTAFDLVQSYFWYANANRSFLWSYQILELLSTYYVWACFTWFIFRFAHRTKHLTRIRMGAIHIAASAAFALIHIFWMTALYHFDVRNGFLAYPNAFAFQDIFRSWFHLEILVYWMVFGLAIGFDALYNKETKPQGTSERPDSSGIPTYLERIVLKQFGTMCLLEVDEIDWIEAAENYVNIHVGDASYLYREKMHTLESQLNPNVFKRIHRSTIVNVARVREIKRKSPTRSIAILHNGTQLSISRRKKTNFKSFFAQR